MIEELFLLPSPKLQHFLPRHHVVRVYLNNKTAKNQVQQRLNSPSRVNRTLPGEWFGQGKATQCQDRRIKPPTFQTLRRPVNTKVSPKAHRPPRPWQGSSLKVEVKPELNKGNLRRNHVVLLQNATRLQLVNDAFDKSTTIIIIPQRQRISGFASFVNTKASSDDRLRRW